jgi:ATP-dependent helicase YprA (DUF1998 family)
VTIFDLHSAVLADYRDFVRSFFLIADDRARAFVDRALEDVQHLWPEPLLQLSPAYAAGPRVDELAREGSVLQETARIFSHPDATPFRLYRHQEDAIRKALAGENTVVTSGTGSGKSLCYFLPIVESLVRRPDTGERVAALVVYPMNALVDSQFQVSSALKERDERALGRIFPVTFAKHTGDTTEEVSLPALGRPRPRRRARNAAPRERFSSSRTPACRRRASSRRGRRPRAPR